MSKNRSMVLLKVTGDSNISLLPWKEKIELFRQAKEQTPCELIPMDNEVMPMDIEVMSMDIELIPMDVEISMTLILQPAIPLHKEIRNLVNRTTLTANVYRSRLLLHCHFQTRN
jgi:hypothetical protein